MTALKLRMSNPAPTSNMHASATSAKPQRLRPRMMASALILTWSGTGVRFHQYQTAFAHAFFSRPRLSILACASRRIDWRWNVVV